MLPAKSVGFVTVFSPCLATAFSHVNTSINCLVLEMERPWLNRKWKEMKGNGRTAVGQHRLCSWNSCPFLPSENLSSRSAGHLQAWGSLYSEVGSTAQGWNVHQFINQPQLFLGLGWFPIPVLAGWGCGHGAPAELWDCPGSGHWRPPGGEGNVQ